MISSDHQYAGKRGRLRSAKMNVQKGSLSGGRIENVDVLAAGRVE
jgi:hypothetical protein